MSTNLCQIFLEQSVCTDKMCTSAVNDCNDTIFITDEMQERRRVA